VNPRLSNILVPIKYDNILVWHGKNIKIKIKKDYIEMINRVCRYKRRKT
jgi:hypothetical protein